MLKFFTKPHSISITALPTYYFSNSLHTTGTLNCSGLELYQTVLDVDQYYKFVPACIKSQITRRVNDSEFYGKLTADFKLYTDSYTSHVTHSQSNDKYKVITVSKDNDTFKLLKGVWEITEAGSNKCRVNYNLEYEFSNFLYQNAARMFISTLSQLTLQSFEK